MKNLIIVLVVAMAFITGCDESQKVGIRPLDSFLIPVNADWKASYPDTIETKLVFGNTVLRINEKVIVDEINKLHPEDTKAEDYKDNRTLIEELAARIEAIEKTCVDWESKPKE